MAGKVRVLKQSSVKKTAPRRVGTVSAKSLKVEAVERAFAVSPAQYLGVRKGRENLRLSRLVAEGLATESAAELATHLELSPSDFAVNYLRLPKQTLARRKVGGKLTTAESDRVVRYACLLRQAVDMMEGDNAAAIRWLKTPQTLLADQTPLQFARTESGAREVQQLIGRIELGVYS